MERTMEEFNQLWNEVKAQLTDNLPAGASVLLSRVDLRSIENGVALITAQSKFVLDSIKDYKTVIENLLSVKTGENITVSIEVSTDTKVSEVKTQNKDSVKISQKRIPPSTQDILSTTLSREKTQTLHSGRHR